jgi:hypothetical protein
MLSSQVDSGRLGRHVLAEARLCRLRRTQSILNRDMIWIQMYISWHHSLLGSVP